MATTDITHTTKPSERPHPEARLLRDLETGIAEWMTPATDDNEVPDFLKPVKPRTKRAK